MKLLFRRIASPLGAMLLITDGLQRVHALDFEDHRARQRRLLTERLGRYELVDATGTSEVQDRLTRYFDGELTALDDIEVDTHGNDLQREVWNALRSIPAGTVLTYGELSRQLGYTDPRMAKDIGAAIGANPVAVIVPCHRVIGADGELKGYAWGLHRKERLLAHEGAVVRGPTSQARLAL